MCKCISLQTLIFLMTVGELHLLEEFGTAVHIADSEKRGAQRRNCERGVSRFNTILENDLTS